MKGLAICNIGIEDVAALDVKELLSQEAQVGKGFVTFDIASHADLCKLCYWGQSVSKALLVLEEYGFDSLDELEKKIQKNTLDAWLTPGRTFRVDVSSHDEIDTQDLRGIVGGVLLLATGERLFRDLVPFLILGASALLAFQDRIRTRVTLRLAERSQFLARRLEPGERLGPDLPNLP